MWIVKVHVALWMFKKMDGQMVVKAMDGLVVKTPANQSNDNGFKLG